MIFPEYKKITPKTLRLIQRKLNLKNHEMADLLGVAVKTWTNRISAYQYEKETNKKYKRVFLLHKLEYEHLKHLVKQKEKQNIDS